MELLRVFTSHIAVVPGLIDDTGDLAFVIGIAENKSIFPAVLHKPFLHGGIFLGLVQVLVADIHNIHRQAQLVLAGPGHRDGFSRLRLGVGLGIAPGQPAFSLGAI